MSNNIPETVIVVDHQDHGAGCLYRGMQTTVDTSNMRVEHILDPMKVKQIEAAGYTLQVISDVRPALEKTDPTSDAMNYLFLDQVCRNGTETSHGIGAQYSRDRFGILVAA